LTTHEVNNEADAWQIVAWYQVRWTIEKLFRVTKSQGLGLEESQIATAERLMKLTRPAQGRVYRHAIVQERDGTHGLPASHVFSSTRSTRSKHSGRYWKAKPSGGRTRIRREVWHGQLVMARLGWNCYYGPPGPISCTAGWNGSTLYSGAVLGSVMERDVRLG